MAYIVVMVLLTSYGLRQLTTRKKFALHTIKTKSTLFFMGHAIDPFLLLGKLDIGKLKVI